jgi:hypothetical protein
MYRAAERLNTIHVWKTRIRAESQILLVQSISWDYELERYKTVRPAICSYPGVNKT